MGGPIGGGRQYVSWIALDDAVGGDPARAVDTGALGGRSMSPRPPPSRNRSSRATLGRVLGRPTLLSVPAFGVRLMFGEMAGETILASQRLVPAASSRPATRSAGPRSSPRSATSCRTAEQLAARSVSGSGARALPVGLAQLPLEQLARRIARQRVHEVDRRRALVAREPLARVGDDARRRVGSGAGPQHHDGLHRLAPALVRARRSPPRRHARMARERVLHLGRIDVLAAGDDHVLHAVGDEDVALRVDEARVAGVEPAVA